MKSLLKNNWISLVLIGAAVVWATSQIQGLPSQLPSHFDLSGHPDKYENTNFILAFMPLMNLFVICLLAFLAKVSPKGFEMPNSQNTVGIFNLGVTIFLMALYVGMVLEGKEPHSGYFAKFLLPGFPLFMVFVGNYFGKLERNFFIGIRLPWTLATEENWKNTHRFAGKVFVIGGLIAFAMSLMQAPVWMAFSVLILIALISCGYSFFYFLKYEKP